MKSINYNLKLSLSNLLYLFKESLFNILILLMKPFLQVIYKKYNTFKKYSVNKQNRIKRTWKRRFYIVSFSFVLGIILAFSSGFFCKDIKAENNELLHKYYTSYKVETGDSLWTIADSNYDLGYDNHAEYINEVISINHLKDADDIISGETLIIPYYSYEIK